MHCAEKKGARMVFSLPQNSNDDLSHTSCLYFLSVLQFSSSLWLWDHRNLKILTKFLNFCCFRFWTGFHRLIWEFGPLQRQNGWTEAACLSKCFCKLNYVKLLFLSPSMFHMYLWSSVEFGNLSKLVHLSVAHYISILWLTAPFRRFELLLVYKRNAELTQWASVKHYCFPVLL